MSGAQTATGIRAEHWDSAYRTRGVEGVSWYQPTPIASLQLIENLGISSDSAVVDIGGGASVLVDRLLDKGFNDVSVLDISKAALEAARERLGADHRVSWLREDLLTWHPRRRFDLWHDRAVLHFLTDEADRGRYLSTLRAAIEPGGAVVIATFAPDGPDQCSGLPVARYSSGDLATLLGDHFQVVDTYREVHTTPGGGEQPFTWVAARATA